MNASREDRNSRTCCSDDCCSAPAATQTSAARTAPAIDADSVRGHVRESYGRIARSGSSEGCCSPGESGASGGCCGASPISPAQLAEAIGYSAHELEAAPEGANMGLSCGNPTAIASLARGEVVLDLGAGGGFDCFIAGPKVGAEGRVIGVDMTPDMVSSARRHLESYRRQSGLDNIEFRLGEIENLPVADASVDVVISNCVLNLSPDKPRVWHEIARVLRPGGRVAISDLALLRPLPDRVREDIVALVGCIAGAVLVDEIDEMMRSAGLGEISLATKASYLDAMRDWQDPLYRRVLDGLPEGSAPGDYITSLDIRARMPRGEREAPAKRR